jgi:hypothetical protein
MNTETANALNERTIWSRGLYMLLFLFFLWLAKFFAGVVIFVQFFHVVFTGTTNKKLTDFGLSLSTYNYQALLFLTFNTEEHPYPMSDWPEGPPTAVTKEGNGNKE